jgi:hypothetical protein
LGILDEIYSFDGVRTRCKAVVDVKVVAYRVVCSVTKLLLAIISRLLQVKIGRLPRPVGLDVLPNRCTVI